MYYKIHAAFPACANWRQDKTPSQLVPGLNKLYTECKGGRLAYGRKLYSEALPFDDQKKKNSLVMIDKIEHQNIWTALSFLYLQVAAVPAQGNKL